MLRARQTLEAVHRQQSDPALARLLKEPLAAPREGGVDLREINLHGWEGRLKAEIAVAEPDGWATWKRDPAAYVTPDGQRPLADLWDRALANWDALRRAPGTSTLVVAHGAMNRALLAAALGCATSAFQDPRFGFGNCDLVELAWPDTDPTASHWRRLYTEETAWQSAQEELAIQGLSAHQRGREPSTTSPAYGETL